MLIPAEEVVKICKRYDIQLKGALHVGAHECEELNTYVTTMGIDVSNIIWIEGNVHIYNKMVSRGVQNMFNVLVDETDDKEVNFNITNNGMSSSILEFGTHSVHHPNVVVDRTEKIRTKTLKTFSDENNVGFENINFWNFDIQGVELRALKGAGELIKYADILYLEVNTENVYKDCALVGEIDEYVSKYGFKRVLTDMTNHGWGDAIYVKNIV
jgi:FkbM family methyltransferase